MRENIEKEKQIRFRSEIERREEDEKNGRSSLAFLFTTISRLEVKVLLLRLTPRTRMARLILHVRILSFESGIR